MLLSAKMEERRERGIRVLNDGGAVAGCPYQLQVNLHH